MIGEEFFTGGKARNALLGIALVAGGWCIDKVVAFVPSTAAAEAKFDTKLTQHDQAITKLFELQGNTVHELGAVQVQNAHIEGKLDALNTKIDERFPSRK